MDREIASGFFDFMLVDTDFTFVNYYNNVPLERCDSDPNVQRLLGSTLSIDLSPSIN